MSEPRDNLYNADEAVALSRELTGSARLQRDDASPYIRFSAGARPAPDLRRAAPKSTSAPPPPAEAAIEVPEEAFGTWEEMLRWALRVTRAKACFVVDAQGFVLIRDGERLSEDGFEGAGASLGAAMDQLNQVELEGGELQVADLLYRERALLAVRVRDRHDDVYTVGIVDAENVSAGNKHQLHQQVQRSLVRMTP